jgi:pyrroloquinoline quinone biosynthesis protein D
MMGTATDTVNDTAAAAQAAAPAGAAASALPDTCIARIAPGLRLQWEPAQGCHVILYPEGMVKLNQSAGEILSLCDGARDLASVVAALEAAFNAQGLRGDVEAFLRMAAAQGWIKLQAPAPKPAPTLAEHNGPAA